MGMAAPGGLLRRLYSLGLPLRADNAFLPGREPPAYFPGRQEGNIH